MENPSKMKVALKWGGIMGAVLLIINLLFYVTGMTNMETGENGILGTILNYVVSIGAVVMAISEYKKLNSNYLSLGEGTVVGLLTGIVGGVIMGLYTMVFFSVIAPDLLDTIKEQAMAGAGDMDPDQEEMMGGIMNAFMSPGSMFIISVVMKFFLGLIFGFIASLFMKQEKPFNLDTDIDG